MNKVLVHVVGLECLGSLISLSRGFEMVEGVRVTISLLVMSVVITCYKTGECSV